MRGYFWFICMTLVTILNSCSTGRHISYKNVKEKYVYGDGKHDDWQAIQSLLDKGGNIYFPAGIYKVSNTLHITKSHTHLHLHKDAIIECRSESFAVKGLGNGGATISFNHPTYMTEEGEYITDVGIEGGHVRNTTPNHERSRNNENAISFSHCDDFYCRNVVIDYCNRKGITAQYFNKNGLIEDCTIRDCGLHGITIETSSDSIIIRNNHIYLNASHYASGLNLDSGNHYGLHLTSSNDLRLENNEIEIDEGYAICANNIKKLALVKNTICQKGAPEQFSGVYLGSCMQLSITGNTIDSNSRGLVLGIHDISSTNNTVEDNKISARGNGLVINIVDSDSTVVQIKGNNILSEGNSLVLSGQTSTHHFDVMKNNMTSDLVVTNSSVTLRENTARSCNIQKPLTSPFLEENKFQGLNVMNASEQTRPVTRNNEFEEDYKNWKPKEYNDKIKGKRITNKKN